MQQRIATIERMASLPPVDFMDAINTERSGSLTIHLATIQAFIAQHNNLPFDALWPPNPDATLHHLRLPIEGEIDQSALDAAGASFVADAEVEIGIARFATLPIPLPSPLLEAYRTIDADKRHVILGRLVDRATTPLDLFHVERLLLEETRPHWKSRARTLSRQIINFTENQHCAIHLSMAQWATRTLHNITSAWSDIRRACASWILASELYRICVASKLDLSIVETNLTSLGNHAVRTILGYPVASDLFDPLGLTPTHYLVTGMTHAFEPNPEAVPHAQRLRLSRFLTAPVGDFPLPHFGVRLPTKETNTLTSFFSSDFRNVFNRILTEETALLYTDDLRSKLWDALLQRLDRDPSFGLAWISARHFAPIIDQSTRDRFRAAAKKLSFIDLLGNTEEAGITEALTIMAFPDLLDQQTASALRAALIAFAEHLSRSASPTTSQYVRDMACVLHELGRYVCSYDTTPTQAAAAYASYALELMHHWPTYGTVLAPFLFDYTKTLAIEESVCWGDLIIRLRSST